MKTNITKIMKESLRASEFAPTIAFIDAKKVTIDEKHITFSNLEFEGSYCFEDETTHFSIYNYFSEPVWESTPPIVRNYFVGRTELIWNSIPHTSFSSEKPHLELTLSTAGLSLELSNEKIFKTAIENVDSIDTLAHLLFEHQISSNFVEYFKPEYKDAYEKENKTIEEIFNQLKEKKLIFNEKVLFPLYMYCITSHSSVDYYKLKSEEFGLIWLTPNVCVTHKEKNFLDFLDFTFGNLDKKTI